MKKAKIFGRSIPVLAIVAIVASAGLVSAALLSYYGKITATVDVQQSVLVDGTNYLKLSEESIITVGGNTVVTTHSLTNRSEVPATVNLVNSCSAVDRNEQWMNSDGVTTKYFELLGWSDTIEVGTEGYGGPVVDLDDTDDPYTTLGNILIESSIEDGWVVFTVTTPAELIGSTPETYSGTIAFIIDEDADGITDWQVSYEPGSLYPGHETPCDWGYEEALETGTNPEPRAFVDATTVNGIEVARDEDSFIVKVSSERLGGCGSEYKFGLYISHLTEYWGGSPGGAGQVIMFYPVSGFDWADMSGYPTRTVGSKTTQITIPPGETIDFYIRYNFDIATKPGTYTITTTVVPK